MENKYNRQELFMTSEGQQKLAETHVGIVGLGGLGSHVAQSLAYLGIKNITMIDDDTVEITNLNRLVGAYSSDIGSPKVDVIGDHLSQINPNITLHKVNKSLLSQEAFDALSSCDFIFGCLDADNPRQVLMEFSAIYSINYLDLGTEIHQDNDYMDLGGRIVLSIPGKLCLVCAGEIDIEVAKFERLTEEGKERERKHGYGLGPSMPAPAVISLNGVVANLAVTEFLKFITDLGENPSYIVYHATRGKVNVREVKNDPDCFTCGYLAKSGEVDYLKSYLNHNP